ncbi:hypothetical protein DSM104299_04011 [Baekduia alba]|uniref:hypothetical protein n=1 Tax=Baekduia alba TaxID=2997333 RepID=UPI0023425E35|nr:hypothetical protein [Baekduia alba]WCB95268.1 hypothetical protein DSM104299_04011 [Baekduia alba]
MLQSFRKATLASAAVAISACALIAPASGVASKALVVKSTGTQKGTAISGKIVGGSIGKGTYAGKVTNGGSGSVITWKVKGGTLRVTTAAGIVGRAVKGTFTVTGGTGKYKGAKGKGKLNGNLNSGLFTFTGSLS